MGSNDEVKIGNKMVKARQYPWGTVQGIELAISIHEVSLPYVIVWLFFERCLCFVYCVLNFLCMAPMFCVCLTSCTLFVTSWFLFVQFYRPYFILVLHFHKKSKYLKLYVIDRPTNV